MRLATLNISGQTNVVAESQNGSLILLAQSNPQIPNCLKHIIADWENLNPKIQDVLQSDNAVTIDADQADFAPVLPAPEKIICIGRNYAEHAAETGADLPEIPVVFNKFPTALIGHEKQIVLPSISDQVDYEAELVVVIGKQARNVSAEDAMGHVFGYCVGHDVSARDWQKGRPGGQWLLGKTFDTFGPIGPFLVTADQVGNAGELDISLKLNGEVMQSSNTKNFIFPIDYLISHLSKFSTLNPGDLIFTGTPEGVGAARKPPVFLKQGDLVEIEIENVGLLRNSVTSG